jgi:hypothetical protein
MLSEGQEERQLAIERNDYHQEVPANKPGEFIVAINSFRCAGPLHVTILPHTARTLTSKRFDPVTLGLVSSLNVL